MSVPGKELKDSVELRLTEQFKIEFTPKLLHRLDMATSGIMILQLKERIKIKKQFLNRTIQKRYIALLDGAYPKSGEINLLFADYENRPNQMVCYEHGKSKTVYEVIHVSNGKSLVYFHQTGRTHQLRVHASHQKD